VHGDLLLERPHACVPFAQMPWRSRVSRPDDISTTLTTLTTHTMATKDTCDEWPFMSAGARRPARRPTRAARSRTDRPWYQRLFRTSFRSVTGSSASEMAVSAEPLFSGEV